MESFVIGFVGAAGWSLLVVLVVLLVKNRYKRMSDDIDELKYSQTQQKESLVAMDRNVTEAFQEAGMKLGQLNEALGQALSVAAEAKGIAMGSPGGKASNETTAVGQPIGFDFSQLEDD